jgi:DNA-binding response OmpR family regulator
MAMTAALEIPPEQRRRILVVEDEEEILVLVRRILRSTGHEVDTARDGAEALAKIEARRPDLIVLDLIMPGVDGWGVLARLKTDPKPPPVVLLTGRTDYETFARGVREGAVAYVVKPFRFHELVATCQRVLLASTLPEGEAVPERRGGPRRFLIVETDVLDHDDKPMATGQMLELSLAGARLELGLALEVGERVRIAFHIPSGAPLHLEGEVRWRSATARGQVHGIEFCGLDDEVRRLLGTLLGPLA